MCSGLQFRLGSSFSCMMQPTENVLILVASTNHVPAVASLAKHCHDWDRDLRPARLNNNASSRSLCRLQPPLCSNVEDFVNAQLYPVDWTSPSAVSQPLICATLSYSFIVQPRRTPLQLDYANSIMHLLLVHLCLVPEEFLSRSIYR